MPSQLFGAGRDRRGMSEKTAYRQVSFHVVASAAARNDVASRVCAGTIDTIDAYALG